MNDPKFIFLFQGEDPGAGDGDYTRTTLL